MPGPPLPRLIRYRDAPRYLGMDRNRFNAEVRPSLTEIPIGRVGIAFDRLELDAWVDDYIARNGRPGRSEGGQSWDATTHEASSGEAASGMSTSASAGGAFAKALAQLASRKRNAISQDCGSKAASADLRGAAVSLFRGGGGQNGIVAGTINNGLQIVRRILNVAAREWMDDQGLTWLQALPKIKLIANPVRRQPYPLSWDEQSRLFRELPSDLAEMALFAVNTRCRSSDICALRWEWEVEVPELGTCVFIAPGARVKNGDERLVVLNRVARSVVEAQRGKHATHVFTYDGKPRASFLNSSWEGARERAGLPLVRVHDLKHTFGRRLRAAGVSFEDRQDPLGHRSGRITTHYSAAELSRLIEAAERVAEQDGRRPDLVVLRGVLQTASRKTHANAVSDPGRSLKSLKSLVPAEGIEPPTFGLQNRCSTD